MQGSGHRARRMKVISDSPLLTKRIAAECIASVIADRKEGPFLFFLKGDLGAGKTTFALGMLSHFGIRPHAASPTFVIAKHYKAGIKSKVKGEREKISDIYHIDAYRLHAKKDMDLLGLAWNGKKSLFLIEWPERVHMRPPEGAIIVSFRHGSRQNERIIEIGRS